MPCPSEGSATPAEVSETSLRRVYGILLAVSVCYFGKYFCTSDMYVAQALFELQEEVSPAQLSVLFALGYVSSVLGKVSAGILSDAWGGKQVLMLSATGYITCTVIISLLPGEYFPLYCAMWFVNCFFSLGMAWVSVVAMVSNWIPHSHMGRLMALVSLAPQVGDALARACLAPVISAFGSWRVVFASAAGGALLLTLPAALLTRNEPGSDVERYKKLVQTPQSEEPFSYRIRRLLREPLLYVVAALSGSLYGIRVLFLLYSNAFLALSYCNTTVGTAVGVLEAAVEACAADPSTLAKTAVASMGFTICGCASVLIVGQLKDALPYKHRASMLVFFCSMLVGALAIMAIWGVGLHYSIATALVGTIGLALFGPYKVLGTAFANDIGGRQLKATACSIMGMSDNLTAVGVLLLKGYLGTNWAKMFIALLAMSLISLSAAATVWVIDLRRDRAQSMDIASPFLGGLLHHN